MFTLNCAGRLLKIEDPIVMGILNVTPDSFYEGSRSQDVHQLLTTAEKMLKEGAAILDIGGQSTRPGSKKVGQEEELQRVINVIESLHFNFPEAILSIDTYYAAVARACVEAGASMVNDISGGEFDEAMLRTVGMLDVPYVLMHVKGNAETMHQNPEYENVTMEVLDYFIQKTERCRAAGIQDIIIDPGLGFSKTIQHNFQLLRELAIFSILEKPVMAGISRKSTVYKTLGVSAAEALNGTTVLNALALLNGANILRVHDVKEAVETVKLIRAYRK